MGVGYFNIKRPVQTLIVVIVIVAVLQYVLFIKDLTSQKGQLKLNSSLDVTLHRYNELLGQRKATDDNHRPVDIQVNAHVKESEILSYNSSNEYHRRIKAENVQQQVMDKEVILNNQSKVRSNKGPPRYIPKPKRTPLEPDMKMVRRIENGTVVYKKINITEMLIQKKKQQQNQYLKAPRFHAPLRRHLGLRNKVDVFHQPKYLNITEPPGSYHCQKLKYMEESKQKVMLASYMGSGNTWMRHLIQEATGIYTGSLYKDPYLYRGGFPAEGVSTAKVIVIKCHSVLKKSKTTMGITKGILLIRDPFQAMLADYNRHNKVSSNEHTGLAPSELFEGGEWKNHAMKASKFWAQINKSWLEFKGPILPVLYDHLRANVSDMMRRVITFLGVPIDEANFQCMLRNNEGNFHRKTHNSISRKYDNEMIKTVLHQVEQVNEKLKKRFNLTVPVVVPRPNDNLSP